MLERIVGQVSDSYRRARRTFDSSAVSLMGEDSGRLQGDGLEEFLQSCDDLSTWSRRVMAAELLVSPVLLTASTFTDNRAQRNLLFTSGLLLLADGAFNYMNGEIWSSFRTFVAGENYLDLDLIRRKIVE